MAMPVPEAMSTNSIIVRATWDDDARVWVATTGDVAGLAVEADTLEKLRLRVLDALADLIELNGIDSDLTEIPVHILSDQLARVSNPTRA